MNACVCVGLGDEQCAFCLSDLHNAVGKGSRGVVTLGCKALAVDPL